MKTFEDWYYNLPHGTTTTSMKAVWNASAENSTEEIARLNVQVANQNDWLVEWRKADERIKELTQERDKYELAMRKNAEAFWTANNEISGDIATIRLCDELLKLCRTERDKLRSDLAELAAQNQQLRLALQNGLEYVQQHLTEFDSQYGRHPAVEDERRLIVEDIAEIESAISLPDLASQHLNRVKAEALNDAADWFNLNYHDESAALRLRELADAIEKGEG